MKAALALALAVIGSFADWPGQIEYFKLKVFTSQFAF
jgi:hypothetical protein